MFHALFERLARALLFETRPRINYISNYPRLGAITFEAPPRASDPEAEPILGRESVGGPREEGQHLVGLGRVLKWTIAREKLGRRELRAVVSRNATFTSTVFLQVRQDVSEEATKRKILGRSFARGFWRLRARLHFS